MVSDVQRVTRQLREHLNSGRKRHSALALHMRTTKS
jgi:hypothetical protein